MSLDQNDPTEHDLAAVVPAAPGSPDAGAGTPIVDPRLPARPDPDAPPSAGGRAPGRTLGGVAVVLGAVALWLVGLPLAVVSLVRSARGGASRRLAVAALVVNIVTAVGTVVALVMLGSVPVARTASTAAPVSVSRPATRPPGLVSRAASSNAPAVGLGERYRMPDGIPLWAFPGAVAGWHLGTVDVAGANQLVSDDGRATFSSFQGYEDRPGLTDLEASRAAIRAALHAQDGFGGKGERTTTFRQLSDGRAVEFLVQAYERTGADGTVMRGVIAAREFDGGDYLVVDYEAPAAAYDPQVWTQLAGRMAINDSGL